MITSIVGSISMVIRWVKLVFRVGRAHGPNHSDGVSLEENKVANYSKVRLSTIVRLEISLWSDQKIGLNKRFFSWNVDKNAIKSFIFRIPGVYLFRIFFSFVLGKSKR